MHFNEKSPVRSKRVQVSTPNPSNCNHLSVDSILTGRNRCRSVKEKLEWIEKTKDLHSQEKEKAFSELNPQVTFKKCEPVYIYRSESGHKSHKVEASSTQNTFVIDIDGIST